MTTITDLSSSLLTLDHPSYKSPLNKKRRFVPNPNTETRDSLSFTGTAFNSPLLVHVYGQEPSESDVQTQLFQVGMRVRKSVNDGYQVTPREHQHLRSGPETSSEITRLWNFAEDSLEMRTPEKPLRDSRRKKRYFTEDAEDDSDCADFSPMTPSMPYSDHKVQIPPDYFDINYDFDSMQDDISPTTIPEESPSQKRALRTRINGRMIAIPRSRQQKEKLLSQGWSPFDDPESVGQQQCGRHQSSGTRWLGHEKTNSERRLQLHDFEEADFLLEREDIDMDCS